MVSIVPPVWAVFHPSDDWTQSSIVFRVRTVVGDYVTEAQQMQFLVTCASGDLPYNTVETRFRLNVLENQIVPEPPNKPTVHRVSHHPNAIRIEWSTPSPLDPVDQRFEVQWSEGDITFGPLSNMTTTTSLSVLLSVSRPLQLRTVYVRVRLLAAVKSPWSISSEKWVTAQSCDYTQEFLNSSGPIETWRCQDCPAGASCAGQDVVWQDVRPLFGWWRNSLWTEDMGSNFTQCEHPPACLGARNNAFIGKYIDAKGVDLATAHNESCNNNDA
eukprot:Stramenopile-MAST_4_protein_6191